MSEKKGFFESLGESMDNDLRDAKRGLKKTQSAFSREHSDQEDEVYSTLGDVVRALLSRAGKDVQLKSIDENFGYNNLINWVSDHAVGNKFYVAKGTLENSSDDVLCVFFGNDDSLLISDDYPKICFVYTKLNPSIMDLFANGNEIYVKNFKIGK